MLENLNDYLSLIVLIISAFAGLRLLSGALSYSGDIEEKKSYSVFFGYSDNEDE